MSARTYDPHDISAMVELKSEVVASSRPCSKKVDGMVLASGSLGYPSK